MRCKNRCESDCCEWIDVRMYYYSILSCITLVRGCVVVKEEVAYLWEMGAGYVRREDVVTKEYWCVVY